MYGINYATSIWWLIHISCRVAMILSLHPMPWYVVQIFALFSLWHFGSDMLYQVERGFRHWLFPWWGYEVSIAVMVVVISRWNRSGGVWMIQITWVYLLVPLLSAPACSVAVDATSPSSLLRIPDNVLSLSDETYNAILPGCIRFLQYKDLLGMF